MLYFVRHGESESNLNKTFAGSQVDALLTEKGREQARETAQVIINSGIKFDRIISSPLKRAYETAEIINESLNLNVIVDMRIIEYDMGDLSGQLNNGINSHQLIASKNAEDIIFFKNRIVSFLKDMEDKEEFILIVAHAGIARMIESIQKDLDITLFYDLEAPKNAELLFIQK